MCFGDFWDFRIFTSVHWSKPQGQMLWHNISRMLLSSALQHIWYCRSSHGLNILLEIEKSRFTFFFFFFAWIMQKNPIWNWDEAFSGKALQAGRVWYHPPSTGQILLAKLQAAPTGNAHLYPRAFLTQVQPKPSYPGPDLDTPQKGSEPPQLPLCRELFSCSCFQNSRTKSFLSTPEPWGSSQDHLQEPCWAQRCVLSTPEGFGRHSSLAMSTFPSTDKHLDPGDGS